MGMDDLQGEKYNRFEEESSFLMIQILSLLFTFESQIYEGQTLKVQSVDHSHWHLTIRVSELFSPSYHPFSKTIFLWSLSMLIYHLPTFFISVMRHFSGSFSNYKELKSSSFISNILRVNGLASQFFALILDFLPTPWSLPVIPSFHPTLCLSWQVASCTITEISISSMPRSDQLP